MANGQTVPLPLSEQLDDNAQEKNQPQRRFVLKRLKPEDLLDDSPAVKIRKIQINAKAKPTKIKNVPVRSTINTQTDLEDTPPWVKFKKSRYKEPVKSARKVLFCNNELNNAKKTSTKSSTQTSKQAKPKTLPNLGSTESLIDLSEAEDALHKKHRIEFKKPFSYTSNAKSKPTSTSVLPKKASMDCKISTTKKNSKSPKLPASIRRHSLDSPADSEFLELEKHCRSMDKAREALNIDALVQAVSSTSLNSPIKTNFESTSDAGNLAGNNTDVHKEILIILQKQQKGFERLEKEFKRFQYEHSENIKHIENLLKNAHKENQNITLPPRTNNLRVSTLRKRFQTSNVPLGSRSSPKNTVPGDTSFYSGSDGKPLQNIKLEKAASLYNSMRMNYASVLTTPKFEQLCILQSVQSIGKRKESISTKIQKQCWSLQSTPDRK